MIPGLVGQLEALEAIKIATGKGDVLSGRMLIFDGKASKFRELALRKRQKDCRLCGDSASLKDPADIDYKEFCPTFCDFMESVSIPESCELAPEAL